ncbi:MAG: cytochrome ubiquinol oxidase subunit I [Bacteroidia bacterium]|nr:cytochrome ubiquinol oxidase subunit I [Bacteroidia bacterium]
MISSIDISTLVDWSRAQFALTAMYHWLFVPLTLGITWIIAMMETIYVKTGDPEWQKITKFWMKLFGINFAIGVATGIILEFEFGTNWSNYSWFVGDIFGAPLAIEGIMAFFMESTFIAIMFFGWNKVSKKFHLLSSWLVAIGANLSALWILVANAGSAKQIAEVQPMKLAAMEGLYDGKSQAGLVAFGILNGKEKREAGEPFAVKLEMPNLLSWLAYGDPQHFVAGINDFTKGNASQGILSIPEKVERGTIARNTLINFKNARTAGNLAKSDSLKAHFYDKAFLENNFKYFGYGFIDDVNYYVPNVPLTFYSFHIMVILGFGFMVFFALFLFFSARGELPQRKFWLRLAPWVIPMAYIASEAGWIVAELGRQPWTIQDLLPTVAAVTKLDTGTVIVTFILFAVTFTVLAIAEVNIMVKAIKHGPKNEGGNK